ncbi:MULTISPECIES: AAA family ATPase [unclassified Moraxella]|uniref:AAA family ATPase n=1 Tax=unclassified Moraxella TaxID=2685852 RepID=UPI003AF62377
MTSQIKSVEITKLFGDKNVRWQLNHTNVLVGKNGMGKSTILQLILGCITHNPNDIEITLCQKVLITLNSGNQITLSKEIGKNSFREMLDAIGKEKIKNQLIKSIEANEDIPTDVKNQFLKDLDNEDFFAEVEKEAVHFSATKQEEVTRVEFISTINLNANSIRDIDFSDGKTANLLDFEIQTQLNRLLKINDQAINANLLTSLNEMFGESNKKVGLNSNFELEFSYKDELLYFPQLSSGERQVIYILLKVAIASHNNALILMDEPEISLHLSWQEKLLNEIRRINSGSQVIIVTHSPAIVMNGWLDSFVDINDILVES